LGGKENAGIVFKLALNGKETVLYSFCSADNCTDGANPDAGVTAGGADNFYGTTQYGGSAADCAGNGCGTVFKITTK
jgi:uncharacterized repeat protein (TIGR03803 family)